MKINEIIYINHEYYRKRYVTIASTFLEKINRIRDIYYTTGKLPPREEIDDLLFNIDILNNNVFQVLKTRPNYSAYKASEIIQEIYAIIYELNIN